MNPCECELEPNADNEQLRRRADFLLPTAGPGGRTPPPPPPPPPGAPGPGPAPTPGDNDSRLTLQPNQPGAAAGVQSGVDAAMQLLLRRSLNPRLRPGLLSDLTVASFVNANNSSVAPPTLDYGAPPQANQGEAYSLAPTYTGTGVTFAVTTGSLPAGLSLNNSTGAITGTPTAAGDSTFTVTATNAGGSASQTITISVVFDPTPSGHVEHGTFRFANDYGAGHTGGDLTAQSAQVAVNYYGYNPDTGEYIRFTFVSGNIVGYSRAQLGSSAAAISSATVWTSYRPAP